VDLRRVVTVKY